MTFVFLLKIAIEVRRVRAANLEILPIKKGRISHLKNRKIDVRKCGHIAHRTNPRYAPHFKRLFNYGFFKHPSNPLQTSSSASKTQLYLNSSKTAIFACFKNFFFYYLGALVIPHVTEPIKSQKIELGWRGWT